MAPWMVETTKDSERPHSTFMHGPYFAILLIRHPAGGFRRREFVDTTLTSPGADHTGHPYGWKPWRWTSLYQIGASCQRSNKRDLDKSGQWQRTHRRQGPVGVTQRGKVEVVVVVPSRGGSLPQIRNRSPSPLKPSRSSWPGACCEPASKIQC